MSSLFEIIEEMQELSQTHDIIFEVDYMGLFIKKYFNHNGAQESLLISIEMLKERTLNDCVLEFEKRLVYELNKEV